MTVTVTLWLKFPWWTRLYVYSIFAAAALGFSVNLDRAAERLADGMKVVAR